MTRKFICTDEFSTPCGCRSVGECYHDLNAELCALFALVDAFSDEMKIKLKLKYLEGRGGWDDPACEEAIRDPEYLKKHLKKGQEVDMANLMAMLWNFQALEENNA